jgi:hypothetical protein
MIGRTVFLAAILSVTATIVAVPPPAFSQDDAARRSAGAQDDAAPPARVPESSALPDSLRSLPAYVVRKPTESSADLMTLSEIIARCVEGEKTKLAGHRDMTFTGTVRVVTSWKDKRLVIDSAFLAYADEAGFSKMIPLGEKQRMYKLQDGEWVYDKDEKEEDIQVGVEVSEGGEGLAELPFFLKDQSEYTFTLLDRVLEGDHVIFKIAFRPRTDFKPLPSGTVYVDTDAYRIIHEEFTFDVQNPMPLLLKDVRRVTREWRELPTGEWVVASIRADAELRGGWFGKMPKRIELGLNIEDYRFDQGYDEARFGTR